ncbi:hypothetical protein LJR290_003173 [Variovorax sp. LjRoot290]|uniref:hypothetical protein n=1 Tax=Variovorax sp. LjRoot290 TaxID=3342316 RepID=UPI003ECEF3A4
MTRELLFRSAHDRVHADLTGAGLSDLSLAIILNTNDWNMRAERSGARGLILKARRDRHVGRPVAAL